MTVSTNSSISNLDIASTDGSYIDRRSRPDVGITITEPSPESKRRNSTSDTESIESIHPFPNITSASASELSGTASAACTCICPMTGSNIGPPCRICRSASYNLIQEAQARRARRQDRFKSITSAISSKFSALSRACRSKKQAKLPSPPAHEGSHAKKDSIISWPESEATCVADERSEEGKEQKDECSGFEASAPSRARKLSMRGPFGKGFLQIPDTDEEKKIRRLKKRENMESHQYESGSADYWHDERGMIDWRIVWAMGAMW